MERVISYYQLDDLGKPFSKYEPGNEEKLDPTKIKAACFVSDTESGLAIVLSWTSKKFPSAAGSKLLAGMKSQATNKGLERLESRLIQFDWKRLRNDRIQIEFRGLIGIQRRLLIDEGGLLIKKGANEERLVVTEPPQQVVLSVYFVAPAGKRVGISFFGFPLAEAGQVSEYLTIAQDALDCLKGLEPLRSALGSASVGEEQPDIGVGRTGVGRKTDEHASTNAAREASFEGIETVARGSPVQRRSMLKKASALRGLLTRSPWLELRYAIELVVFWTMIHWWVFNADWRLLLPVPIFLLVVTIFQSPLMLMAKNRRSDPTKLRGVIWSLIACGLMASQVLAFWSVPSSSRSAVFLWLYLAAFQIRVTVAMARYQINAMTQSVLSYLNAEHWVQSGDTGRYEQLAEPLRGEGTRFVTDVGRPIEAEGQSQISLLIRLFCGVIGAIAVVLTYFAVGMRFPVEGVNGDFIYKNNEGFTAALALLIIVTSTVAVQMFADLARVIREREEYFEREVSKLAVALGNVESGLIRIWGHLVEYLPDVSRTFNSSLEDLCKKLSTEDPAASSALERRVISHGSNSDLEKGLADLRQSSVVEKWFEDGYFNAELVGFDIRSLLRQLASRLLDPKSASSEFGVLASTPYDEKVFLLTLDSLSKSLPNDVAGLRKKTEQMMSNMCLKTSRYVESTNQPQAVGAVLTGCDNLDIDASYFLDDLFLFTELVGSARLEMAGEPKAKSRGVFAKKLRDAEYARVMYVAAWLAQVNSYVATRLHAVLEVKVPTRTGNKVNYVGEVLTDLIPKVFASETYRTQNQVRDLLKDDETEISEESDISGKFDEWFIRASLSMPESAIHCLVRAALARKKRVKLVQFETSADSWQPKRVLSLAIIPKISDRVRHLRALLEIPDRPQNMIRMRSVHEDLSLPASEAEKREAARLAHEKGWVDFELIAAQRFLKAVRRLDTFCQAFGPTNRMSNLAIRNVSYLEHILKVSDSGREPQSGQTVGNNAFDEVRQWYEDNGLRWSETRASTSEERRKTLHNGFHRYHCLLRLVDGKNPLTRERFTNDFRNRLIQIFNSVDHGVAPMFHKRNSDYWDREVTNENDEQGDSELQKRLDKTRKFCMDENNNEVLVQQSLGFFENLAQLNEWRKRNSPESDGATQMSDQVTELDDRNDAPSISELNNEVGGGEEIDDWPDANSNSDSAELRRDSEYGE